MNSAKTFLGVAALAAVSWFAMNGVGRVEAQNGAKPLTAQDLLDIRALIDGYSHLLDTCRNNGNDYADQFTPDATFGVSSEWGKAKIWFRGREQLRRAGGGGETECRPRSIDGYAFHLTINPVITATPTGAHAISTLLTITNDTDARGDVVHWEGGYEDTFEKTANGWRFKSRVHVWPEVQWTDRVEDMPPRRLEDE
ncbi:MAG TPA: nuclear transport factor 2 family protein [Gammaproteobacteria bacterium]